MSFVARQLVFRISDNFEYRDWFVDQHLAILADYFEYVAAEFVTASAVPFRRTDAFGFLIEEPLIDFDPFQAGLRHGLILGFGSHFTVVLFMNLLEYQKLVLGLVLANRIFVFAYAFLTVKLAYAFTCDLRTSIRRILSLNFEGGLILAFI